MNANGRTIKNGSTGSTNLPKRGNRRINQSTIQPVARLLQTVDAEFQRLIPEQAGTPAPP